MFHISAIAKLVHVIQISNVSDARMLRDFSQIKGAKQQHLTCHFWTKICNDSTSIMKRKFDPSCSQIWCYVIYFPETRQLEM